MIFTKRTYRKAFFWHWNAAKHASTTRWHHHHRTAVLIHRRASHAGIAL